MRVSSPALPRMGWEVLPMRTAATSGAGHTASRVTGSWRAVSRHSSSEALISYISRTYEIDANILLGDIELIDGNPLGGLVVIASGEHDRIAAAMGDLSSRNVLVEVIARG